MNIPTVRGRLHWTLILLVLSAIAKSENLDLPTALHLAESSSDRVQIARARVETATGENLSAWAGFVPVVRTEMGLQATDEPLGSFATRLGQRRVSMASFDPKVLNDPETIVGWNAAVVAEVPLVNLDAWQGKRAAGRNLEATKTAEEAERSRARIDVVESWYAISLARASVEAWSRARETAEVARSQARSAHRNETATRTDLLRADVEVGSIEASLASAKGDVVLAEKRLAMVLGLDELPGEVPAISLTDSVIEAIASAPAGSGTSTDLRAMELRVDAASADLSRNRMAFLPRLNGVARLDWKGRESPFEEDPSWSVGVQANWILLGGAGDWGRERTSLGHWREASVGLAAMKRQEKLQRESQRIRIANLVDRLRIGRANLERVAEVHRIELLRYSEGLATLADALEAGARATSALVSQVALRQEAVVAMSTLALLEGRDPPDFANAKNR